MPRALRGAYGWRHNPPCAAAYASSCQGCSRAGRPARRSWTSRAAMSVLLVAGSKTSMPKRCAPAYAAASSRFFSTLRVRVAGATVSDTGNPAARASAARQRCSRLARA